MCNLARAPREAPLSSEGSDVSLGELSNASTYLSPRDLWALDGVLDDLLNMDDLPAALRWMRGRLRVAIDGEAP